MLTAKYKPMQVTEFIGLEKPKKIIGKWLANPQSQSFLFVGDSGTGKTAMAEAIARALGCLPHETIQIKAGKCDLKTVDEIWAACMYLPWGPWRVYIVNEADRMTDGAQIAFLDFLDAIPTRTVIIFTANGTVKDGKVEFEYGQLEPRFLSRCAPVLFSNYGLNGDGSAFLASVWEKETEGRKLQTLFAPDFPRILKNQRNNLRGALQEIERELLEA